MGSWLSSLGADSNFWTTAAQVQAALVIALVIEGRGASRGRYAALHRSAHRARRNAFEMTFAATHVSGLSLWFQMNIRLMQALRAELGYDVPEPDLRDAYRERYGWLGLAPSEEASEDEQVWRELVVPPPFADKASQRRLVRYPPPNAGPFPLEAVDALDQVLADYPTPDGDAFAQAERKYAEAHEQSKAAQIRAQGGRAAFPGLVAALLMLLPGTDIVGESVEDVAVLGVFVVLLLSFVASVAALMAGLAGNDDD